MFEKILVANRGEIAVRIIRACKETQHSHRGHLFEADANSMHVQLADEAPFASAKQPAQRKLSPGLTGLSRRRNTDVDAIIRATVFLVRTPTSRDVCEKAATFRFIGPTPGR